MTKITKNIFYLVLRQFSKATVNSSLLGIYLPPPLQGVSFQLITFSDFLSSLNKRHNRKSLIFSHIITRKGLFHYALSKNYL